MDYVRTCPPVAEADIESLIATIEPVKTPTIDGAVLSNLVRVCYECALRKRELIGLSIKDVAKKGSVGDFMKVGEDEVKLSSDAKQVLQNHIDYLKRNGYRLYPTSPLFRTKENERYNDRRLDNHLKNEKISEPENNMEDNIGLEKIRQAGICKYYEQLKDKGLSPRECLSETKDFARVEKRQTKDILTGNIQPTGKKVSPFIKNLHEIEAIEVAIKGSETSKKRQSLKQIYDDIKKDNNLSDDEKEILESKLERLRQKMKEFSSSQKINTPTPQFKSIADIVKKTSQ